MIRLILHTKPEYEGKPYHVAENWNELQTAEQLADIAEVFFTAKDEDIAEAEQMRILLGMSKAQFAKTDAAVVIENMRPFTEWLKTDVKLMKQLFPTLRVGWLREFYGPAEGLVNIGNLEYDHAERAMFRWYRNRDDHSLLWQFVATLYRPKKRWYNVKKDADGDPREQFNHNLIDHYAAILQKHVPIRYAYAILLWYRATRQQLIEDHPRVFNPEGGEKTTAVSEPSYHPMMVMMAEKQAFGTLDKVEQMSFIDTLYHFEHFLDQQKRLEQEIEKKRKGG